MRTTNKLICVSGFWLGLLASSSSNTGTRDPLDFKRLRVKSNYKNMTLPDQLSNLPCLCFIDGRLKEDSNQLSFNSLPAAKCRNHSLFLYKWLCPALLFWVFDLTRLYWIFISSFGVCKYALLCALFSFSEFFFSQQLEQELINTGIFNS